MIRKIRHGGRIMRIVVLMLLGTWLCLPGIAPAQAQTRPRVVQPSTIIAVIDSGIDIHNSALMDKVWTNPNETPDNNIDDDQNGCIDDIRGCNVFNISGDIFDSRGHGTYVASVPALRSNLSAGLRGKISPQIKIFPIRALAATKVYTWSEGKLIGSTMDVLDARGSVETLVKAIDSVIATSKATNGNFIVNASWSFNKIPEDADLLDAAFKRAETAGILVVVSAGNCNGQKLGYPASLKLSNMISVGATIGKEFAFYSCIGADIATDGTNMPDLGEGYAKYLRGTSFAAPMVALTAAEVWERHPDWTCTEVRAVLLATADPVDFLEGKVIGNRLLNFETAISK